MKMIYLVLLIAAYVSAADEEESGINRLGKIIEIKCKRKSGETALDGLGRSLDNAWKCAKSVMVRNLSNTTDFLRDCDVFSNSPAIYECVAMIFEKLGACLDEEEPYLKDFLYGAFNQTVIECCGPTGIAKLNYMVETLENLLGRDKSIENLAVVVMNTCLPLFTIFKSGHNVEGKTYIVTESEICSDLMNFETCLKNMLNGQSNTDHTKFVHYLMEPYLQWCISHV